jgi:SAM-dependent methyltransferase
MVFVVVIGMGAIYGLYLVRSIQVYFFAEHPYAGLVRLSVFLSFATTFLGVSVLALSDNILLQNAGRGLALGLGYSFLGAVLIVPPLMKKILSAPIVSSSEPAIPGSGHHIRRILRRYRYMESYPRAFSYFKMKIDPMFRKLHLFLASPRVIIDIGTGFGVPAAWILELYPQARLHGIEPDHKRAAIASRVVGKQGSVQQGRAPDLPDFTGKADTALLIDMTHFMTDEEFQLILQRIKERLTPDGRVIIRTAIPRQQASAWKRWLEEERVKLTGGTAYFRAQNDVEAILTTSGFDVVKTEDSAPGQEDMWFLAHPKETLNIHVSQNGK